MPRTWTHVANLSSSLVQRGLASLSTSQEAIPLNLVLCSSLSTVASHAIQAWTLESCYSYFPTPQCKSTLRSLRYWSRLCTCLSLLLPRPECHCISYFDLASIQTSPFGPSNPKEIGSIPGTKFRYAQDLGKVAGNPSAR